MLSTSGSERRRNEKNGIVLLIYIYKVAVGGWRLAVAGERALRLE